MNKKIFFSEKAQSGAVFRLLIDAIIMIVILLIILSVLTYFHSLRLEVSTTEFKELVVNAVHAPKNTVIKSESLVFSEKKSFSSSLFRDLTGYHDSCFSFTTSDSRISLLGDEDDDWELDNTGSIAEFNSPFDGIVFVKCISTGDACETGCSDSDDAVVELDDGVCKMDACCEFKCLISFGKELFSE